MPDIINWLRYLTEWTPASGRVIKEDGLTVNIADLLQRADAVSNPLAILDGIAFNTFWRGTLNAGETKYFTQQVNIEGGSLRGIGFNVIHTAGPVELIQYVSPDTIGAELELITGRNIDRRRLGIP